MHDTTQDRSTNHLAITEPPATDTIETLQDRFTDLYINYRSFVARLTPELPESTLSVRSDAEQRALGFESVTTPTEHALLKIFRHVKATIRHRLDGEQSHPNTILGQVPAHIYVLVSGQPLSTLKPVLDRWATEWGLTVEYPFEDRPAADDQAMWLRNRISDHPTWDTLESNPDTAIKAWDRGLHEAPRSPSSLSTDRLSDTTAATDYYHRRDNGDLIQLTHSYSHDYYRAIVHKDIPEPEPPANGMSVTKRYCECVSLDSLPFNDIGEVCWRTNPWEHGASTVPLRGDAEPHPTNTSQSGVDTADHGAQQALSNFE